MMRFRNVPEPASFSSVVEGDRAAILRQVMNGDAADFRGRESWKRFKSALATATFGKCGYCEVDVVAGDRFSGDVEHYRPKGRVDRLLVAPDGSVRGEALFSSGYHWLAYSWSNYILTCSPCNSSHKRNFFPLRGDPTVAPVKGDETREDGLLLSPFGRKDPTKHLVFDALGVVGPRNKSLYGRATIAVCGLSRGPLEKKRRRTAKLVQLHLDVLGDRVASADSIDLALQTIAHLGMADQEHCGMVRSMFRESTGMEWSYVEAHAPCAVPAY